MAWRHAFVPMLTALSLAGRARAQTSPEAAEPPSSGSPEGPVFSVAGDPPVHHPLFAIALLSAELGTYYVGGAKLGFLGTPFSSGISFGGSVFFAPLTSVEDRCAAPCTASPLLWRWMADLRLGTAYRPDRRGLAWLGLSAGLTYLAEPGVDVSPVVSLSAGGDVRLSRSAASFTPSPWFEFALRGTWAQILAPDSSFAAPYISFAIELGARFDLTH